ncbi:hypothetical protein [Streptomyces sp. NPDC018031]|uniref:hypothetical protein n=1 Tax=Streptomyces sp. NPDC018031 TaxID=3365033 RepID=UPI0037B8EDD4
MSTASGTPEPAGEDRADDDSAAEEEPGRARSRRVGWTVAIGSGVAIATAFAALVTAFTPWLTGGGGGSDDGAAGPTPATRPGGPATPDPSTVGPAPSGTPPAAEKPCGSAKAAHGFRAAFIAPCDGGSATAPYPTVTLAVPRYPAGDGSQGRIWIVSRILTNGAGTPLADEPLYGQYPVERKHADRFTATTWQKNLSVFRTCHEYGPTELSVYWLDPGGAKEAERWRPGVTITVPARSTLLDKVTVTLGPSC